jgi:hypothetical protein
MKILSNTHSGIYTRIAKERGISRQRVSQILRGCTCTYKDLMEMGWKINEISGHAKGCLKFSLLTEYKGVKE